nr:hypothetical protein [Megasphaera sp.]
MTIIGNGPIITTDDSIIIADNVLLTTPSNLVIIPHNTNINTRCRSILSSIISIKGIRYRIIIADNIRIITVFNFIGVANDIRIFTAGNGVFCPHDTRRFIISYGIGRTRSRPTVYDDVIRRIGRHPHTGEAQSCQNHGCQSSFFHDMTAIAFRTAVSHFRYDDVAMFDPTPNNAINLIHKKAPFRFRYYFHYI